MPESYTNFKKDIREHIINNFGKDSTILDVGPGVGTYATLLSEYNNIDCVEIFQPYIDRYNLSKVYRKTYNANIVDFEYENYDIIIFGDILEHLSVPDAQKVLKYAYSRCKEIIVSVPYRYRQGIHEDNIYEIHLQDDLTPQLMHQRYPELKCVNSDNIIGFYIKN